MFTDKIQNFLSTYVGTHKQWDEGFADMALSDDEDDQQDASRKGLKYMQQLVCVMQ